MKRVQVEHVLRAAAAITAENSFFVVGSQAILLQFPFAPDELTVSRELDLYPALNPEKSDLIDGAIGALSSFDETLGYHADGVGPETAVMPPDWHTRETFHYIGDFIRALFKHRMIALETMVARIATLDDSKYPVQHITQWTQRRAQEATA
jgi:hypothetical protein